eukprot:1293562-Alexandrium_andersonii.AAC.1
MARAPGSRALGARQVKGRAPSLPRRPRQHGWGVRTGSGHGGEAVAGRGSYPPPAGRDTG